MLMREMLQALNQDVQCGQHHRIAGFLEHQRMAQVVDVFRSAGEVNEFQRFCSLRIAGELIAQPILDGFDVVVSAALDGFDLFSISFGQLCGELVQLRDGRSRERQQFFDAGFGSQRFEPFDFD